MDEQDLFASVKLDSFKLKKECVFESTCRIRDNSVACTPVARQDREISNNTTAVTRQRPVDSNRGTVFSVGSVP
jgi:hypothetical protein